MITIVVPVYNEEKSIPRFVKELVDLKIDCKLFLFATLHLMKQYQNLKNFQT